MKMPHSDDLHFQHSPHQDRTDGVLGDRKMSTDSGSTPQQNHYSHQQPPLNDLSNSSGVEPSRSPYVPALHPEHSGFDGNGYGPRYSPHFGYQGPEGYSYYRHHSYFQGYHGNHHHPHYPRSPRRECYPEPAMSGSQPHYYQHAPPARYTPPYHSYPYSSTPPPTAPSYHDYHSNFIPPSSSMTSAGSTAEDDSNNDHRYSALSPQSATSRSSPVHGNEVNEVLENDVLCGRGAPTNYHQGNEYFRELVSEFKGKYLASKRADKPLIASHIVNIIRSRGGRFLRRYKRSGVSSYGHFVWVEVEPQKAYEKACQALREGAPEIRRKKEQAVEPGGDNPSPTPKRNNEPEPPITEESESISDHETTERVRETAVTVANGAGALKELHQSSDDDRNDELQDSERS